jgi:hypothetical protein
MTWQILKLSTAAAVAAALLASSFPAGAEVRLESKAAPAQAKSPPDTAKPSPATAKPPPASSEPATKPESSRLCIGRLIEMLGSLTAA